MRRFRVDAKKCVGCRICELACSFQHRQEFDPEASKIKVYFCDDGGLEIKVESCDCKQPLCVELCPVQALDPTYLCIVLNKLCEMVPALRRKALQKGNQP